MGLSLDVYLPKEHTEIFLALWEKEKRKRGGELRMNSYASELLKAHLEQMK